MTIQSHTIALIFLIFIGVANAQEYRTEPKHPKGDPAAQMLALVPYNEAVEFYSEGSVHEAKKKLRQSVNTSFALVEAHLFLADILYQEGIRDSALYFYKSGLDFIIEQEPHYYFRLFELGMEFEQYDIVKQFLKYFKKVHGVKKYGEHYEAGYPFTVEDYNYYADNIALVYNFKSWQSPWQKAKMEPQTNQVYANDAKLVDGQLYLATHKRNNKVKWKKQLNLKESVVGFQYLESNNALIYTVQSDSSSQLFFAKLNGEKVTETICLSDQIENSQMHADGHYLAEKQLLYFSAKTENGDWDLFVAKFNVTTGTLTDVKPLDRINTAKDERSPLFHQGKFYFSSNGYEGFGGMDIYYTADNEQMNGYLFPMNHFNMKAAANSGKDELSVVFNNKGEATVLKVSAHPKKTEYLWLVPVELEEQLNYDISLQK